MPCCPSWCHNAFGPGTLYSRRRIRMRSNTRWTGSILKRDCRICSWGTWWPSRHSMPWSIVTPACQKCWWRLDNRPSSSSLSISERGPVYDVSPWWGAISSRNSGRGSGKWGSRRSSRGSVPASLISELSSTLVDCWSDVSVANGLDWGSTIPYSRRAEQTDQRPMPR